MLPRMLDKPQPTEPARVEGLPVAVWILFLLGACSIYALAALAAWCV